MKKLFNPYPHLMIGAIFVAGVVLGFFGGHPDRQNSNIVEDVHPFREQDNHYDFINPLLFYEIPNSKDSAQYSALTSKVQNIVDEFMSTDKNRRLSFYFRDLNEGRWVGINERERYIPASLLKIVVMIAYFKEAESDLHVLSRRITFSKQIQDYIGSIPHDHGTKLQLDQSYTVHELIDSMITDSDNGATYALLSKIDDTTLSQIYSSLGLKDPQDAGREYTISVEDFAPFLRIIYNATYLNRTMSERALALLSQASFHDGIAAGVPRSVKVSHKYGESVSSDKGVEYIELHDCGIVYYPEKPYLLCVMTRGNDLKDLIGVIKEVSETVYEYVEGSR